MARALKEVRLLHKQLAALRARLDGTFSDKTLLTVASMKAQRLRQLEQQLWKSQQEKLYV